MNDSGTTPRYGWMESWFHSVANWSVLDVMVIAIGLTTAWYVLVMARYLWITRKQPVRRDAPTSGQWIAPKSWR